MGDLETLHGYAKQFLNRVRGSITLDEFRIYLRNLDEDASTLGDSGAAARISAAVASVRSCDYVFRNHPGMKDTVVVPVVEKLVGVIKDEIQRLS